METNDDKAAPSLSHQRLRSFQVPEVWLNRQTWSRSMQKKRRSAVDRSRLKNQENLEGRGINFYGFMEGTKDNIASVVLSRLGDLRYNFFILYGSRSSGNSWALRSDPNSENRERHLSDPEKLYRRNWG